MNAHSQSGIKRERKRETRNPPSLWPAAANSQNTQKLASLYDLSQEKKSLSLSALLAHRTAFTSPPPERSSQPQNSTLILRYVFLNDRPLCVTRVFSTRPSPSPTKSHLIIVVYNQEMRLATLVVRHCHYTRTHTPSTPASIPEKLPS